MQKQGPVKDRRAWLLRTDWTSPELLWFGGGLMVEIGEQLCDRWPHAGRWPAMDNDFQVEDGLLRAITELRGLVDQLIDEQIARLDTIPEEPALIGAPMPVAPSEGHRILAVPIGASAAPARMRVSMRSVAPERMAPEPPSSLARKGMAKPLVAEPVAQIVTMRPETDPRQRLDALARHLDDRLRRARDSASDRIKSAAEG